MPQNLKVGIIGASAGRGWAKDSHVPAVQHLAGLELYAVASTDQAKADAAAKAFGAAKAYGSAQEMIADPEVDIVTVAVNVPAHHDLVMAAVAAGKHIYCEWPLGRNVRETEGMTDAAQSKGIHTSIGLQLRGSAEVRVARERIASGAIGRPLLARSISNTMAFGPKVEAAMAFAEDESNGVTLVTIQGAHTFDLAMAVLGPIGELSALTSTQYPEVEVDPGPKKQGRFTPDHVLLQATLASGIPLSIEVTGGTPPDASSHLEVVGTEGTLLLRGGAPRGLQSGRFHLVLNGKPQQVDEGESASLSDSAANVAGIYAALRDDIQNGTMTGPDFQHALDLARFIQDVTEASASGTRKSAKQWPGMERRCEPLPKPDLS